MSCTRVILNVDHLDPFDNLTEALEVETSICINQYLIKIIGILKENIGLGGAIRRIIGDVLVVRSLLGSKVSKPLKELI